MSKLTFPLATVQVAGTLHNWYYNNCVIRSDVQKSTDETNAYAIDNFDLNWAAINVLLTNSGEIEQYLMAIHANIAMFGDDVPVGLPNRTKYNNLGIQVVKSFSDWLVPGAEVWKKDDNSEIIFYTNPFALNVSNYLKGSEIALIKALPNCINVLKVSDAQALVTSGWTKL